MHCKANKTSTAFVNNMRLLTFHFFMHIKYLNINFCIIHLNEIYLPFFLMNEDQIRLFEVSRARVFFFFIYSWLNIQNPGSVRFLGNNT